MAGIIYTDAAQVESTSGQMVITFSSGGDDFRFHLPPHVAVGLRDRIMRDGWQVLCIPNAEVVSINARKRRRRS